jgi:transcription termination factor Rho
MNTTATTTTTARRRRARPSASDQPAEATIHTLPEAAAHDAHATNETNDAPPPRSSLNGAQAEASGAQAAASTAATTKRRAATRGRRARGGADAPADRAAMDGTTSDRASDDRAYDRMDLVASAPSAPVENRDATPPTTGTAETRSAGAWERSSAPATPVAGNPPAGPNGGSSAWEGPGGYASNGLGANGQGERGQPADETSRAYAPESDQRARQGGDHAYRFNRPAMGQIPGQGQPPFRRGQRPMRPGQERHAGPPPMAGQPMSGQGQPPMPGQPMPGQGQPMPNGQAPQGGQQHRMRFDRQAQRPGPGQHTGHPQQGQGPRDRRGVPGQHGAGGRNTPQRGQGTPGRGERGGRGSHQQPPPYGPGGYVIPGYGVPQPYGNGAYGGPDGRQQRQGQRVRPPAPPAQPARTFDVRGVLWVRGSVAELLDERAALAPVATMSADEVRRMGLRPGDVINGRAEERGTRRQVVAVETVNGMALEELHDRPVFEQLTAISPRQRITLEHGQRPLAPRIIDLFAPLGYGARALIVAPPKTGKTTFLRETAEAVLANHSEVQVLACLVGERPEEVTDLRSALEPRGGLVYAASFDEQTERHAWLVQITVERAKRVAENGGDVLILLDSLTRLARAENLATRGLGRTLSGGIDAQALDTGRRAFGAARCLEEGGSITIMATCLVDTGSRQDEVVYEEFKGTGNMEIYLSRDLSQRRIFPAVDAVRSGTRREELLLTPEELKVATALRRYLADKPLQAATTQLLNVLERMPSNAVLVQAMEQSGGLGRL